MLPIGAGSWLKVALGLLLVVFAVVGPQASTTEEVVLASEQKVAPTQTKTYLQKVMQQTHTPGVSFALIKDGQLFEAAGYGLANIETHTPANAETVYKIASLSKAFLSAAVLMLMKEGKLELADKACSFLTDCPESWKTITVYQLLTHTSGLVRDPLDYQPYLDQPIMVLIHSAYTLPLHSAPGTQWLYSNLGYYVLAEIVTKASGQPWTDFIQHNILYPAGMTATQLSSTTAIIPYRASGYQWKDGKLVNAENWIANRPSSAYVSNVLDLVKWNTFLDRLVAEEPATWGNLWTASRLVDGSPTRYGFGWYSDRYLKQRRIHHDGQYPGFYSEIDRFPESHLAVIVVANSDSFPAERSAVMLAGLFEPKLKAPDFRVTCSVPASVPLGKPIALPIQITDRGVSSDDTVLEIEIWDRNGKPVYKDSHQQIDFKSGQTRSELFFWTPEQPGEYTLNIGVYGPRWFTSFSWKQPAATLHVL